MIRNYFKTAWRNLIRNKGFAVTNLVSLTIGIASTILILLWVHNELSWNKHHKHFDSIYQVYANRNFNGTINTDNSIMLPLADALESELPVVAHAAFTSYSEDHILSNGDIKLKKAGYRVSRHYFDIFSFNVLHGSLKTALSSPDGIVVTKSTAMALFNTDDVINRVIRVDNTRDVKIAAVVDDLPRHASYPFDFVAPYSYE
ncbi:MAG: ABC transporter permease, partial [Sphingobacteriales bacterium]